MNLLHWPWRNLPETSHGQDFESATKWPRISIITPSYNQAAYLEETIRSVLLQGYPNLDYYVIDGGSTDGSVEIIKKYEQEISGWISGPDEGQSHAIQKGMELATGQIVNWLNSDDLLLPGALFSIAEEFMKSSADIIVGRDLHFHERAWEPVSIFIPSGYMYKNCVKFWTGEFRYHQPCTFFTRSLYNRAGGIDKNLHYAMDYDLYCRMMQLPCIKVTYIDRVISAFRLHERTKTSSHKLGFVKEMRDISMRHWSDVGFDEKTLKDEMDKYTAKCLVHQTVEAIKKGTIYQLIKVTKLLGRTAPVYAARYALSLLVNKLIKRKHGN